VIWLIEIGSHHFGCVLRFLDGIAPTLNLTKSEGGFRR
jgi:hypothetical protein